MSRSAADDADLVLSRPAFIVAWTLASVVPWVTTTLLWRIDLEFGRDAVTDEVEAARIYRIVNIVAWHLGNALNVLIEARLLRQFRDDTRWWWIIGIALPLVMEPLYALVPAPAADAPIVDATIGLRVAGGLLWAVLTWRLIRLWSWRDRYWLGFNVVVALALPLVDYLGEQAGFWTKVLCWRAGISDYTALQALDKLSNGLLFAVIVSAPTAWLLWQYVIVHRRDVAAPAVG